MKFIKDNRALIKRLGKEIQLNQNGIIATSMAIAEEYSAREEYFGIKAIIDDWQDYKCKRNWPILLFTDFGKANINEFSARAVDVTPLMKSNPVLAELIKKTISTEDGCRQFMVTDEGTIVLSLLLMVSVIDFTKKYTENLNKKRVGKLKLHSSTSTHGIVE